MMKFTSNSAEVLKQIPVERRGKHARSLDLDRDKLSPEKALGMKWSVERDTFQFEFKEGRQAVTRRGILSVVSSIFDPLGMVAPVTLAGKTCYRNCVRSNVTGTTLFHNSCHLSGKGGYHKPKN